MVLIAKYDCFVANEPTDSVDYKVRYFEIPKDSNVDEILKKEDVEAYKNGDGEIVEWRYAEIMAIDWNPEYKHGEEVIGFITGKPILTDTRK